MPNPETTRRAFLQSSSALLGGSLVAPAALAEGPAPQRAGAFGPGTLRVALVGCGGRGTGAASQALATAGTIGGKVELVAMADAFEDRLAGSLKALAERHPDQVKVPAEHRFTGFDAYRQAIDAGCDVVVLATPPGFRPMHFEYAVRAGKHVFMEKPVAVDAPGVRRVLEAAAEAQRRNLKVGVGLQRHHSPRYTETVQRLRDGAIGELTLLRCYWNSEGVWTWPRKPDMSEMTYQMRNWYYFNWLCGDHIVEQHIHNLDVANWLMQGYPVEAQGQGGRQVRTGPDTGEIYDHHLVEFTYADGTKLLSQCRHQGGCWQSVSEHAHGTRGTADLGAGRIESRGGWSWRFRGEDGDPYQTEHDVLFRAIREDRPHAEAENGAKSTMTAILGRMATYSGRVLRWDEALASELALAPSEWSFDGTPPSVPDADGRYPIAVPGVTRVV